jgi:aspartyl aminopeptidase
MDKDDFNEGLLGFLDASTTPFHATQNMAAMFKNAGFIELFEQDCWELEEGSSYFVRRNDSSIVAFTYPKEREDYVMVATHTDSPNLKLKPNPVIKEHGVVKFGVEPYGGLLLSTWFDRELSLAGRISYLDAKGELKDTLIDAQKPLAIIPSLAIHLDDKANKDKTINKQTDISPILTTDADFEFDEFLRWQLSKVGVLDAKEIYASELSFYDAQKASFAGLHDDFILSSRIDNLLSCYVGMLSICSVDASKPMLFVANDHEEIGSQSAQGADGSFLEDVLKRIFKTHQEYVRTISASTMISVDNAHAIHPNFPSKHDANHAPHINKGVVIKVNANQRYASNSKTISKFLKSASKVGEKTQYFVTRSDLGCGSTIGPITSANIGIPTIDVGVATYAMHSIRESAGRDDAYALYKILVEFEN